MRNKYTILFICILLFVSLGILFSKASALPSWQDLSTSPPQDIKSQEQEARTLAQNCRTSPRTEFCYAEGFGELTTRYDLDYAREVLLKVQSLDPTTEGCHFIAHSMAAAAVRKDPENWQQALDNTTPAECTGGYLMGVMEERHRSHDNHSTHNHDDSLMSMCQLIENQGRDQEQSCAHIVGHLTLTSTKGDLDHALQQCAGLPSHIQYECFGGVFMESEVRQNLVSHGYAERLPWNDEAIRDQEDICHQQTGLAAKACWRELSHMYAYSAKSQPKEAYSLCQNAPSKEYQDECYIHAVGIMSVSRNLKSDYYKYLCEPGISLPIGMTNHCLHMSVKTLMTSSTASIRKALNLCAAQSGAAASTCNYFTQQQFNALPSHIHQDACKIEVVRRSLCT